MQGEQRLLIDGKLVEADRRQDVRERQPRHRRGHRHRRRRVRARHGALRSARRGGPSTPPPGRPTSISGSDACASSPHALTANAELIRATIVAEVGSPRAAHLRPAARLPARRRQLGRRPGRAATSGSRTSATPSRSGCRSHRYARREATGVVAAITPWNFPMQINLAKVVPALGAGNTVVLKPAPDTPWTALLLGQIVAEHTDIPPGVLNIVTSSDHQVGAQLSADPRVDLVSFTGSTATGRTDHGRGRRHHQEDVPRARRQVGAHRPRRRRPRPGRRRRRRLPGHLPRRAGLRHHQPAAAAPRRASTRASTPWSTR